MQVNELFEVCSAAKLAYIASPWFPIGFLLPGINTIDA
jgi:hypothetical protein